MDYYFYPYIALTGGGDGALDSLDGSLLKNGDGAVVIIPTTNITYIYTLDEDSAADESSPTVIKPDSNAGDKRWVLTTYYVTNKSAYLSDYATIADAIVAIGATNTNLIIDTTGTVSANLTIPSNVTLSWFKPGCTITVATTRTLTINGKFPDSLSQVFVLVGSGTVVFGTNTTPHARPEWFGAAGDASTDDSAAVQAAVTSCLSTVARPLPMLCAGRYRIATAVNIDRQVSSSPDYIGTGVFRIIGEGRVAGFYASTAINMFTTSITVTTAPQSEAIDFENLQFEVDAASTAAHVLEGDSFLRVNFKNCRFFMIKCLTSAIYTQSIHFESCLMRLWSGVFFDCPADPCYDISFNGCKIESGDALWTGGICSGCRFVDNICEYITGRPIKLMVSAGVFISGNYFEGCDMSTAATTDDPYIETGVPFGVALLGNHFALTAGQISDADFFAVYWWDSAATGDYSARGISAGNYCSGKMHDKSDLLTYGDDNGLFIAGDYCTDSPYPTSKMAGSLKITAGDFSAPLINYADNAAALAGGKVVDDFYRIAGDVAIVV